MSDDNKKLRIIFMGTPDFAVPALEHLIDGPHEIVCVYSQPPRPKNRGQQVQLSPVHQCAQDHGIEVRTPKSLRKDMEARAAFDRLQADVAVVAAYGQILPQEVLDMPRYGCLNIHASALPRWRGAAPIQYAIWKGDTESGVTIMQMEAGLDTGPMIAERRVAIHDYTTAQSLHDELSALGGAMIAGVLDDLAEDGALTYEVQDGEQSTYAPMLKKSDGLIDWAQSAAEIDRQVRALNPWPGVWTGAGGKRLKILETAPRADNSKEAAGTVLDKQGHVACGGGSVLQLRKVQPENAKAMDFAAALNGHYLNVSDVFAGQK